MEWEAFRQKIVGLQHDLQLFETTFLDVDGFIDFFTNFERELYDMKEVYITGYFSEVIRKKLERVIKTPPKNVRIICPEFPKRWSRREEKNLMALYELSEAGAKIKVNNRSHARFLVAFYPYQEKVRGKLIIGTFDFNSDCLSRERFDAGIKTSHPDLIRSAIELFNQIWDERGSKLLSEK